MLAQPLGSRGPDAGRVVVELGDYVPDVVEHPYNRRADNESRHQQSDNDDGDSCGHWLSLNGVSSTI